MAGLKICTIDPSFISVLSPDVSQNVYVLVEMYSIINFL